MADKFQLKALITGVDKLSPTLTGIRKSVAGFRKQMESSGLGNIGFADIAKGGALAAPFIAGVREAIKFESAMADVKKVVNFDTPEQFKQMGDDVRRMSESLPMSAEGIAQIVAAGGQAGFAREELQGFAQDALKMGIAFDQTAEESGSMMAKWRTSFKLTQTEVVGLADKINYLSNTGPASAKQISDVVTRIGPLGEIAGLASGQIAAMGATLAGVGVPSEVAATGMKNFMLAMTKGASATKSQQKAFKSLRLDTKELAKGMQKDAQGTLIDVLERISKVDKTKQAGVLTDLFGTESVGAIAPMLTNLDLLKRNFKNAGDEAQYTGSMQAEYSSRASTTANAIQLLTNRLVSAGITVGNIFLPPLNEAIATLGPMISMVGELAGANPWLVKGLLGAAIGFSVLRLAVMGATVATKIFSSVVGMSPVGLIVRGIALAAGLLIANWSTVAPYFEAVWERISGPLTALWERFKTFVSFTPLGQIIANWDPIVTWFKNMYERIKPYLEPLMQMGEWVGGKLGIVTTGGGSGSGSSPLVNYNGAAMGPSPLVSSGGQSPGQSLLMQAQAQSRTQLEGGLVVRFENAPAGMRADPGTSNQPGLSVTPRVGYRSLGGTSQ
ncbi:phage tail tape measure protein [Pseudomonas sp. FSL R10-0765]|uniref:phage tail tape measure protein n=1 Tax=Pseudomonas sp. FSL R10-0765 TaxID=2662195 RepID=UPI00129813FE|nr:phage tail tape measure protein [Pseudomonas sp. FSL R10-0765]MQT41402.1 phage tail tape measure protein [Pseudomonas sp. FSL R10-0765]